MIILVMVDPHIYALQLLYRVPARWWRSISFPLHPTVDPLLAPPSIDLFATAFHTTGCWHIVITKLGSMDIFREKRNPRSKV